MNTPQQLLDRARIVFQQGRAAYRDALLEAGRLLHEYVYEFLREGDGLSEADRMSRGITRDKALLNAAASLGTDRNKINRMIAASMAEALLGEGDLGSLVHSAIYQFRVFVQRRRGTHIGEKRITPGRGEDHISNLEIWELKTQFAEQAKSLFRKAVAEGFNQERAAKECQLLLHGGKAGLNRRRFLEYGTDSEGTLDQLFRSVQKASPGDVAELCMTLVNKAEDPQAVAMRLRANLAIHLVQKAGVS